MWQKLIHYHDIIMKKQLLLFSFGKKTMSVQIYNRQLKLTADGSHTLYLPDWQEHFHSVHGALAESEHVFISNGFERILKLKKAFSILEVGFGTGLNALLSIEKAVANDCCINYDAIEPYPLDADEVRLLNIPDLVAGGMYAGAFLLMHLMPFAKKKTIVSCFEFRKTREPLEDADLMANSYDLVYHDAFAPHFQPELWDVKTFSKLYSAIKQGGILVTYSAKGSVKRALRECGFMLEHPAGPAGKREITVAMKS